MNRKSVKPGHAIKNVPLQPTNFRITANITSASWTLNILVSVYIFIIVWMLITFFFYNKNKWTGSAVILTVLILPRPYFNDCWCPLCVYALNGKRDFMCRYIYTLNTQVFPTTRTTWPLFPACFSECYVPEFFPWLLLLSFIHHSRSIATHRTDITGSAWNRYGTRGTGWMLGCFVIKLTQLWNT